MTSSVEGWNDGRIGPSWDDMPAGGIQFGGTSVEEATPQPSDMPVGSASLFHNRAQRDAYEHRAAFRGGLGHYIEVDFKTE